MNFIDHTGHIFSIESFPSYPVGYEYQSLPYKFRLEDTHQKLSVGNYYIRPVRIIVPSSDYPQHVEISTDSGVFSLIGSKTVQEMISNSGKLAIEFDENDSSVVKDTLSEDDLLYIEDSEYVMIPMYVLAYTEEACTWQTNIMIHVTFTSGIEEYCPIAVSGTFYDEREELIINSRNMGIRVDKGVLKAIWGTSFYNDVPDEALWNKKVKELLMNYMPVIGERGNIDSAVSAFKWFGWGQHASIVKLIRNDNDVIAQYVRDTIDVKNDTLLRWEHFIQTGLLSIVVPLNVDSGQCNVQDFDADMFGEGKPVMEDLTKLMEYEAYDEEDIKFYRPALQYSIVELALKLSVLRDYYNKYFLPLHSMLQSASMQWQVHAPDIKYYANPFVSRVEAPVYAGNKSQAIKVVFDDIDDLFMYEQKIVVDDGMVIFDWYESQGDTVNKDLYYIDDVVAKLGIRIEAEDGMVLSGKIVIERNGRPVWESSYSYCNSKESLTGIAIYPKVMNKRQTLNYWEGKQYTIHVLCNGWWSSKTVTLKVPEMHLYTGTLEYEYVPEVHRQISSMTNDSVEFNSYMHLPWISDVKTIDFTEVLRQFVTADDTIPGMLKRYRERPSLPESPFAGQMAKRFYNRVHMYKMLDSVTGEEIPYNEYNIVQTESGIQFIENADIVSRYRMVFNNNGDTIATISDTNMQYDIYLMHDSIEEHPNDAKWYIVLISKDTIDKAPDKASLSAPEVYGGYWKTELIGSHDTILIDRLKFVEQGTRRSFQTDDIIAFAIRNIDMPAISAFQSRWKVIPFSLGMSNTVHSASSASMMVMSTGDRTTGYEKGYYNIKARYSLEGTVQSQRELTLRILVDDSDEKN